MHLLNARGCRNSAVLPSIRIGARQIRFEEEHLLRWIENGGGLDTINPEDQESDNVQTTVAYPAPTWWPQSCAVKSVSAISCSILNHVSSVMRKPIV